MELRHLRYFITVAEELNFSKAALKLYTAQPSLSQQIKDLEEDVGVKLLYRTKRKVELTEEGAVFLEQARLTLAQADKAIAMATPGFASQTANAAHRLCSGGGNENFPLCTAEFTRAKP